jgi:hypothetical protein
MDIFVGIFRLVVLVGLHGFLRRLIHFQLCPSTLICYAHSFFFSFLFLSVVVFLVVSVSV